MRALVLMMLVSGCGPYAYSSADPARQAEVAAEPWVSCAAQLSVPQVSGENSSARSGSLPYCDQSRWDDVFELYFQLPDGEYLRVDVNTRLVEVGKAVLLDGVRAAMWDSTGSAYSGAVTLVSDEPRWRLSAFAASDEDPSRGVSGSWWGRTR
jgi:hypothetical protein